MNLQEFENFTHKDTRMETYNVDCFCGCGQDSMHFEFYCVRHKTDYGWGEEIDINIRHSYWGNWWARGLYQRLRLVWEALRYGHLTKYQMSIKVEDARKLGDWLRTLQDVDPRVCMCPVVDMTGKDIKVKEVGDVSSRSNGPF